MREVADVLDEILGFLPRPPRRRRLLKCAFTDSQLDLWKAMSEVEEKALAQERKETESSEKKFFGILSKEFGKLSNTFFKDPDTQKAISALSDTGNWYFDKKGNPTRPKPHVWKKYAAGAENYFGKQLARHVKTRLTISLKDIYKIVKTITSEKVLNVPVKRTATDKASTEKLAKDVMYWVSDANGRHFEPDVAKVTRDVMAQGLGFRETEDEMNAALKKKYKDKSDSYWFLMGSVGVQRARSFSKLSAFEDGGVTEYEIVAVLDSRTTPQCRYMHGRIFKVSHGQAIRDNTEAATTPEGVRMSYPWVRYSSSRAGTGLDALYVNQGTDKQGRPIRVYLPNSNMKSKAPTQPAKGLITSTQKGTLNKLAPLPPYHGHCRTTYLITEKAIQQLTQERVEEKQLLGAPPFDVSKFKEIPGPTGSHGAYWKTDPETGKDYLVKPPAFAEGTDIDPWMNWGVGQLMKDLKFISPKFYVSEDRGKPVLIQSRLGISGDMNGVFPTTLDAKQILDVQKQFIFDYFVGNLDGNRDNHALHRETNAIVGLDKGQSFKFYGHEKLDGKWKPSNNVGRPFFYDILDAHKTGQDVKLSAFKSKKIQGFIKAIEDVPDDKLRELFMPYATRAEAHKLPIFDKDNKIVETFDTEKFFKKVFERKRTLRKDFEKLYKNADAARRRILKPKVAPPKPPKLKRKRRVDLPLGDRLDDDIPFLDDELLKEAIKARADGKAFILGGRDWFRNEALVYKVEGKGKGRGLHIEARLSNTGANKLMALLQKFAQSAPEQAKVDDIFDEEVIPIVKSIKAHLDPTHKQYDGKTKPETKKAWQVKVLKYGRIISQAKAAGDTETAAKYKHYKDILHAVAMLDDEDELVLRPGALETKFGPFVPSVKKMPPSRTPEGLTEVEKERRFDWRRKRISRTNKVSSDVKGDEKYKWGMGNIYTFKMGDVEFEFTPDTYGNPLAVRRKLVIRVKEEAKQNSKDLQQILKDFSDRVGIVSRPADKADLEVAYLRKYAVMMGVEDHWKAAVSEDKPPSAQLRILREQAAKLINVDVESLLKRDTYKFDVAYPSGKGWAWYGERFDMTKAEFNDKFNRVTLQHKIYSGVKGLVRNLKSRSTAMVSTEEKIRLGIKDPGKIDKGGVSPLPDRDSGGSDFHFCRLAREHVMGELIYNRRLLLSLDSTSFETDNYGAQKGDSRWRNRNRSLADAVASVDLHGNETNAFKHVPIADFVEIIRVRNRDEKDKVIALLKKNGIEKLGGEPVERRVIFDTPQIKRIMQESPGKDFLP